MIAGKILTIRHILNSTMSENIAWIPIFVNVSDKRCKEFTFIWRDGNNYINMHKSNLHSYEMQVIKKIPFDAQNRNTESAKKTVSDYIDKNKLLIKK